MIFTMFYTKGGNAMFCKNCGGEIKNEAKFCPYCGTGISVSETKNEAVEEKAEKTNEPQTAPQPQQEVKPQAESQPKQEQPSLNKAQQSHVPQATQQQTNISSQSMATSKKPQVKKENIVIRFLRVVCAILLSVLLCASMLVTVAIVGVRGTFTVGVLSNAFGTSEEDFEDSVFNDKELPLFQKDFIEEVLEEEKGRPVNISDEEVAEFFEDSKISVFTAEVIVDAADAIFDGSFEATVDEDDMEEFVENALTAFEENFDVQISEDDIEKIEDELMESKSEYVIFDKKKMDDDEVMALQIIRWAFSYVTVGIGVVLCILLMFLLSLTRRSKTSSSLKWIGTNMVLISVMSATAIVTIKKIVMKEVDFSNENKFAIPLIEGFMNVILIVGGVFAFAGVVMWIVSYFKKKAGK